MSLLTVSWVSCVDVEQIHGALCVPLPSLVLFRRHFGVRHSAVPLAVVPLWGMRYVTPAVGSLSRAVAEMEDTC